MRKIIMIAAIFFAGISFATAQKMPAKTTDKTKTVQKKTATADKTTDKTKTTGLKKDGTPDMRLKENKDKAKTKTTTGPTKKDGTPDMRYNANKKK